MVDDKGANQLVLANWSLLSKPREASLMLNDSSVNRATADSAGGCPLASPTNGGGRWQWCLGLIMGPPMSLPEDDFRQLMTRVRAGSEEAARELFDRYSGHISRVVRRRLHSRLRTQYDSLDFLQAVWASFFAVPLEEYTFDHPEDLVRFLARMAYNKVVDVTRRRFGTVKHNINSERPFE